MKLVSTKSIVPGTILAQSIYNQRGNTLLAKGIKITKEMIKRLIQQGVTYIYIEDEFTNDVHIESSIPDKLRRKASKTIEDTFLDIGRRGLNQTTPYLLEKQSKELDEVSTDLISSVVSNGKSISLLADIYISDNYIFQHSLNVAIYSTAIGMRMNMSILKLKELAIGALLHDIGKIFIDPAILNKAGSLTNDEFSIMKKHAELGYNFLREQEYSSVIAHCAYQHHERLDGSGYPRGLTGDNIVTAAKIIGIADVFDAVTSNRVYRDAMLPHEGLELLYAGATNLFDKEMVEVFRESIAVYPEGLTVVLNDNREAVVIGQNKYVGDRPIVRIIRENEKRVNLPYEVDLSSELNIMIKEIRKN